MHTPSPWWIEKGWFGRFHVCAESAMSASTPVASSIYYADDAKLIAACPEMYGALRAIIAEAKAKGIEMTSLARAEAVLEKVTI